jgi:Na+/H+ antiporter NhaD/arsenite permease-like protein
VAAAVLVVFALVSLAMLLGELPGLALDRTGAALLGAIVLVATELISPQQAWDAIDAPTLCLLFGLMVVSAQLRLGGFYDHLTRRVAEADLGPDALLALLVAVAGALSAVLANDIVCLAMAPVLIEGCARRGPRPTPFLLALAAAANVGSAATLIGNPQNMLIGERLRLSFGGYLLDAAVPTVLGLAVVWWVVWRVTAGRWAAPVRDIRVAAPHLDRWQAAKGVAVLVGLVVLFLLTSWPHDLLALGAAGIVLLSRRMASRPMLALVDWHLLVLFISLFVVNGALADTGLVARTVQGARDAGIDLTRPAWLFPAAVVLSNLVSNVPAVMLLLHVAPQPSSGPVLALASTLAGNLLLVGSIANLIVVEQAALQEIRIGWREHARVGVPVTVLTLGIAALWLWFRGLW